MIISIECAYVDRNLLVGLDANRVPANRWPKARKRWQQQVTVPLMVFANAATIVQQTTDPKNDPMANRAILVERFVAQPAGNDKHAIVAQLRYTETLPTPVSFDVVAVLDGEQYDLGSSWMIRTPNSGTSNGTTKQTTVDALPADITYGDLLLVPNPIHVEQRPEVNEIWGKPIYFRNVPLERLDLDTLPDTNASVEDSPKTP